MLHMKTKWTWLNQVLSHTPLTAQSGVRTRPVNVGLVVYRGTLTRVSYEGFILSLSFPRGTILICVSLLHIGPCIIVIAEE